MTTPEEPVVLLVELTIAPGRLAEFLAHADEHAQIARSSEPGCLQFDIIRAADDHVVIYEVYRDAAALEEHRARPQMARFRELTKDLVTDRQIRELRRASDGRPRRRGRILCSVPLLAQRRELVQRLEREGFEVAFNETGRALDAAGVKTALPGVDAVLGSVEPYNAETLSAATDLKIIARFGVGHDQVDVPACTRAGIAVAMAFGANHEAVADHTLALMTGVASRIPAYDRRVRDGGWGSLYHDQLFGRTVGLVGFGRIGRAVAKRCQGFAMRVLAFDPEIDDASLRHLGCEPVGLEVLLGEADFVTLHAPLMPATRHMIDATALARMKASAFLVNTARGPLVDEAALAEALAAGSIAGAALDVFEAEPLPADSPLRALENVVLSPHAAGLSDAAVGAMAEKCVDNILAYLQGRALEPGLILNPEVVRSG